VSDPSSKGPGRESEPAAITVHSVVEVTVRSVRTVTASITEKTISSLAVDDPSLRRPFEPTLRTIWNAPGLKRPGILALMLIQRARRLSWLKSARSIDITAVVAVLVLACFTAYIDRHAASAQERTQLQSVASHESLVTPAAVIAEPVVMASEKDAVIRPRTSARRVHYRSRVRRPEIAEGRVVHIGNDVTVRYFGSTRPLRTAAAKSERIVRKGNDVTVRYFNRDGRVRKTEARSTSADSPKGSGFGANALSELRASETKTPN